MDKLRFAIIGAGASVYQMHEPALSHDKIDVVALTDRSPSPAGKRASHWNAPFYTDHRQMLAEISPDVAVILTPHPFHPQQAIDAMAAGSHVLVEKPMAVEVLEADQMIATARETGRLLVTNFQQRFRPEIEKAYELINSNALGRIQHVDMALSWTRTDAYYASGGWRATWKGEGGGLLLNQAPHDLDILCHLLGMPERVYAWTPTTIQKIETEDTVQAMVGWGNGAVGSVHISTAQGGRPYRLEIIGTAGILNITQGGIQLFQYDQDVTTLIRESESGFPELKPRAVELLLPAGKGNHIAVYNDLLHAIETGNAPRADGAEGRMSLELANAMLYASHQKQEVALPLDRQAYHTLLNELKAGSTQ